MICSNCRSAIATTRYVYGMPVRQLTVLCDPCAASLRAIGMDLRVGRTTDTDLERADRWERRETRDTRPEWMRRMRAKDFTGSIA